MIELHADFDEGRFLEMCCLLCRSQSHARLRIATPAAYYVISIDCNWCGEQLVEFDDGSNAVMRFDGRHWIPAELPA